MTKTPWMKWYPADWRADPGLRMCSYAARGLWADLLSIMHEAEPYGHLLVNGIAPTTKQMAVLLGGSEREVKGLVGELEAAGVFSRIDSGVIYSRRMKRDKEKADEDRANGGKGGNPKLKPGVNPPPNPRGRDGDKAQKLEARSQKLEGEGARDAPGSPPEDFKINDALLAEAAAEREKLSLPKTNLYAEQRTYELSHPNDQSREGWLKWAIKARAIGYDEPAPVDDVPANRHTAAPKPINPKILGHGSECMCSNCERWAQMSEAAE